MLIQRQTPHVFTEFRSDEDEDDDGYYDDDDDDYGGFGEFIQY